MYLLIFNWNFRNRKAFCCSCFCCGHFTLKISLLFKLDDPTYSVQLLDWLSLSCQMPGMNSIQKENKLTWNSLNVLWILPLSRKIGICFPDLLFLLSLRLFSVTNAFHLSEMLVTWKVWERENNILMMNLMLVDCRGLII